jgi:hypothetical protein
MARDLERDSAGAWFKHLLQMMGIRSEGTTFLRNAEEIAAFMNQHHSTPAEGNCMAKAASRMLVARHVFVMPLDGPGSIDFSMKSEARACVKGMLRVHQAHLWWQSAGGK